MSFKKTTVLIASFGMAWVLIQSKDRETNEVTLNSDYLTVQKETHPANTVIPATITSHKENRDLLLSDSVAKSAGSEVIANDGDDEIELLSDNNNLQVDYSNQQISNQQVLVGNAMKQLAPDGNIPSFFATAEKTDENSITSLGQFESRARYAQLQLRDAHGMIELPDVIELELFKDESYTVVLNSRERSPDGMIIWSGRTQSSAADHLNNYSDVTIVVDSDTGQLGATLALSDANYSIKYVEGDTYRISELGDLNLHYDHLDNKLSALDKSITSSFGRSRGAIMAGGEAFTQVADGETDANGVHIIDVLVGFSTSAVAVAGNPDLLANQMIAEVNNGLRNSQVTDVRLRLVRVAETPNNAGITLEALRNAESWFASDIEEYAPDVVALVQTSTPDDLGAGVAWAPGFVSSNLPQGAVPIFRHEVGHNAGMLHCQEDGGSNFAYGYGWAVPGRDDLRTHMCGNTLNYYSNPDITLEGNRLGDPERANAARVWRERADVMSGRRQHTVPFEPTEPPVTRNFTLQDSQWSLLTLPANGSDQTIGQLFEDDLPTSSYGETWTIFTFDQQSQSYVSPTVDSTLTQGEGFWMLQATGADVTIDLPDDVPDGDAELTDACASAEGCFSARISTSETASTWSLLGAPYSSPVEVNNIRISSSNGMCAAGCDLEQAKSIGLLLGEQWVFDATGGKYEALSSLDYLQPWLGFWFRSAALPAGTELTVLFPKPDDDDKLN